MSGLYQCSVHLLITHDFWGSMGSVFIAAMVIGALLDENWKKLLNWVLAVAIFALIEQYVRFSFRATLGFDPTFLCESNAISALVATFYITGLSVGWCVVYFGRRRVRRSYRKKIEEKENVK